MEKRSTREDEGEGMTFLEHLDELRSRLIKSIVALFLGFVLSYIFTPQIIQFLIRPFFVWQGAHLTLLAPTEGFMVKVKTALLAGIVLSSPAIFYHFWKFISPGLYEREKRFILPVVFWSVFLFLLGGVFAYNILPLAMRFFQSFATDKVENFWSLNQYITFVTYLLLAFGLVFELPLVIYFAARMGLVTPEFLRRKRRHAIIVLLILAAIVTPPDVISQIILAIPLIVLYEISIFLAVAASRKRKSLVK